MSGRIELIKRVTFNRYPGKYRRLDIIRGAPSRSTSQDAAWAAARVCSAALVFRRTLLGSPGSPISLKRTARYAANSRAALPPSPHWRGRPAARRGADTSELHGSPGRQKADSRGGRWWVVVVGGRVGGGAVSESRRGKARPLLRIPPQNPPRQMAHRLGENPNSEAPATKGPPGTSVRNSEDICNC